VTFAPLMAAALQHARRDDARRADAGAAIDHPPQRDPTNDPVEADAAPEGDRSSPRESPQRMNDQHAEDGERRDGQDENSVVQRPPCSQRAIVSIAARR
jgi:hypothetical protein